MSQNYEPAEIPVLWGDQKTYRFHYTDIPRPCKETRSKEVYYGYFVDQAPPPLECGVFYYLKKIKVRPDDHTKNDINGNPVYINQYPQAREKHELLQYEGSHLRESLTCNEYALEVRKRILSGAPLPALDDCYVVERPYSILPNEEQSEENSMGSPDFPRKDEWKVLEELTVFERLSYLEQICQALKELYSNRINGKKIAAHRDIKLSNCLIIPRRRSFTVVLTDFATIRLESDPDRVCLPANVPDVSHSTGTVPYIMSRENTAPESLNHDMPITEKVDVYALGNLMASLFGYVNEKYRNPNTYFCYLNGWHSEPRLDLISALSAVYQEQVHRDSLIGDDYPGYTWLTSALNCDFHWGDHPNSPNQPRPRMLGKICELFFRATRCHPDRRCSLDEFHHEIQNLLNLCDRDTSRSRLLYRTPETVCLFLQDNLINTRSHLQAAADTLEEMPVRVGWYSTKDTAYASFGLTSENRYEQNRHWSSHTLKQIMTDRYDDNPVCGHSITEAVQAVYRFYHARQYEFCLNGKIRIFSCQQIEAEHMKPAYNNETQRYESLEDLLKQIYDLSHGKAELYLHTATKPLVPTHLHVYCKPIRITAPSAQPESKKQPVPEFQFLAGSEGLFFLDDGRRVYVSRLISKERS